MSAILFCFACYRCLPIMLQYFPIRNFSIILMTMCAFICANIQMFKGTVRQASVLIFNRPVTHACDQNLCLAKIMALPLTYRSWDRKEYRVQFYLKSRCLKKKCRQLAPGLDQLTKRYIHTTILFIVFFACHKSLRDWYLTIFRGCVFIIKEIICYSSISGHFPVIIIHLCT